MPARLTNQEVAARMVEFRNLRRLHTVARAREARKDIRIAELEATVAKQQQVIEKLLVRVFGAELAFCLCPT